MRSDDKTRSTATLKAQMSCDPDMVAALTNDETGPFAAGAMPGVKAASETGARKVLQALDEEKRAVTKVKASTDANKKKKEASEPVVAKTPLEWGPPELKRIAETNCGKALSKLHRP